MRPDNYVLPYVIEMNRVVNNVQNIINEVNVTNKCKKLKELFAWATVVILVPPKIKRIPLKTFESPTCSLPTLIIYGMI